MRAIVCATPGPPSVLQIQHIPIPAPQPGQVLIRILAFGINRAEMYTRQGHSPGLQFPLIMGIECVGVVASLNASSSSSSSSSSSTPPRFPLGQRVATCMGGLGRQIPGSYAEYCCVPEENLRRVPDETTTKKVSVAQIAALPEMMQTAWGSLEGEGLDVQPGESVLVRGATSSVGICALQLLRARFGTSRIGATTRKAEREDMLREAGADEVFIDDGSIAEKVLGSGGEGGVETRFDKCLELVGTTTLLDSAACLRPKGTLCMTGIQGGQWEMERFSPMAVPNRVRLCAYGGGPDDFHRMPWEELVRDVEEGRIKIPYREFKMEDIQEIHEIMESGGGGAKMVVVIRNE
ncbi:hypothetical protein M406DRAFT_48425 [Cryphonectria parasitica EP155]|uniref:Enoyl reductase (ER) domain-containing protein n=1 Tax=Cryphonectria parasitica (strain ATCC 38755 / EP155) TaxID=660469 RepID=A0A9P4XYI3_CRYP1|nr:uncharacterized protein M406DRAFT_48425 [Cryphonectria parasitica EP155]KAF3763256.1 hypothetical protein M406DRAFT_48425 [Cryphonectria parasitica EP155]